MAAEQQHQHLVYGKPSHTGVPVVYTDDKGVQHEGIVKNLEPVYHADLQVQHEGVTRFFGHIPYNDGGVPGSWTHKPEPEAETETDPATTDTAKKRTGK